MDYVIKPCDWETVYLATEQDPNKFGEALRNYSFVGNCMSTGCYSTFELLDGFTEVKSGKIYEEALKEINPEFKEEMKVFVMKLKEQDCYITGEDSDGDIRSAKFTEPYEIVVAWHWDGDGALYFRWNNRSVINFDCKKDHEWEWINK